MSPNHASLPLPAPSLTAGVLSDVNLLTLAKSTGLLRRVTAKLSPKVLLGSCLAMVGAGSSSFFSLAGLAVVFADRSISRQAVAKRFGGSLREFLHAVLVQVMGAQCAVQAPVLAALGRVRRILIQDSTTMKLHASLATHFPGSANACGGGAALKIQATLDLLGHHFVDFTLSGFTRNDQAAAPDVLAHLRAGDLVLRDLGYLTLESLRAIGMAEAFFVSRYSKMCVFRLEGTEISLGGLLLEKNHASGACVDLPVLLGKEARLPVRLVAVKLDAATAAERRRKALANRDKRMKPTAESLALLDWAIYVTNLPQEEFSGPKISALYGLRWGGGDRVQGLQKRWAAPARTARGEEKQDADRSAHPCRADPRGVQRATKHHTRAGSAKANPKPNGQSESPAQPAQERQTRESAFAALIARVACAARTVAEPATEPATLRSRML